jgi:Dockerin type I domain/BNR/Asp-box repeat
LPTEPLEKYDNPPAPPRKIETSPGMISQFGPFISYQVNVDAQGHNILGDAANEPSIAVDPTDGNKMAIGWRQFDSVTSNFRQAGWGYTTDGGLTWTFPGVLENGVFRSDPVLNSDETGTFFDLSLQSDVNLSFYCDDLWRSKNGGQSWTLLSGERGAGGGDKEWFTIDRTPTSMGHGFQYQYWAPGIFACASGQFSRSIDGGTTWQTAINIPNDAQLGTLDVDSNGNLFIGGGDTGSQFWCIRSRNAQNPAVTPSFDQITTVNLGGSMVFGGPINPGGWVGQIFLAADRSGGPTNNNIYMLATIQPTGFGNGTDVMFARSTNGGQTFSTPKRINDDPVNHSKWHWLGTLAVAPNGRIDSVWLDSRNAANNTDSQLFYSYSTDGGTTWSPNVAVSNSFNPFIGYPNQNKMGDYITIVSDNTGGNVAYAATFNSEEDIYYVRVSPSAPQAQSAFSRKVHGGAGTFDVPLPLTGSVGVECRSGGATNDYQMIVNFASAVTVESVAVTSGIGSVSSFSVSGAQVTVNLTGVTNIQRITVTLHNVNDGTSTGDVPVSMGVLVGDVNGNASVNASDVSLTKSQVGQAVSGSNFREDVNANGTISATDVALVKSDVGTALPP